MKRTGFLVAALLAVTTLAASAQDTPTHIDVALGDVSLNKVPFLIAADAGFYAKNGLSVHQFITPGAAAVAARNGIVVPQDYIGGPKDPPIEVGGGAPLISHAAHADAEPHRIIIATTENVVRDHILTRPDITSEQQLKGKKLGAGIGNVPGYAAIVYLRKIGLAADVTITRDADLESLKSGKVDAIMANLFATSKAPEEGLVDLVDLSKYDLAEAGSGVSVNAAWLSTNRETAVRFIKAMVQATALMKSDKAVFAKTLAKWFNVTDPEMVDRLFVMAQKVPAKPYPEVKGIEMAMQIYASPSLQKEKAQEFYDSSIISELDKSGFLNTLGK